MSEIAPRVERFFDQYPAAREAYANSTLYHQTHERFVPTILAEGLRPHPQLFPEEHGAFLLRMCHRYDHGRARAIEYIKDRIIDPSRIYFFTTPPGMRGAPSYSMPERLMLLMGSMSALANKDRLTHGEREFAARAFEEHRRSMFDGNPNTVILEVDPLAPSIVNHRVGRLHLEEADNLERAVDGMEYVDGTWPNNVALHEPVAPEFIQEHSRRPIDTNHMMQSVTQWVDWTADIL
jgi:hypothetical protein